MTIESTIQRLTNDGEIVVQFLVDVIQGSSYDATLNHRLKSAEWLAALGGTIPEDAIPKSASIRPKSKPKQAKTDKQAKRDKKPPVTEKQILHFDIARAIMRQTRDGESIIEFLIRVVAKIERDGENFTPAARMRAARELLLRGFGNCIPGINRILSGKTEALDSHISKTIREYADYGMEPIRFLIDAMENEIPEIEPKSKDTFNFNKRLSQSVNNKRRPKGFTASQRVWAACELLRRAYDIRTDHITPADIQAYWQSQTPTQKIDDFSTPDIDLMGVTPEQVEAEITQMRASDAAKAAANATAANANTPDGNATRAERRRQQRAARKTAAKATAANQTDGNGNANNSAAAEKPAAKAASAHRSEQPVDNTPVDNSNNAQDNQVSAEKPAAKTVTGNAAATTTRAERRRQQRAAQKAQKPAAATAQKPAVAKTPATAAAEMPATTQKPIDKMLADNTPMSATTASAIAQKPVVTEVIALNAPTAADTPPNLTRATRRREKRAARKAEKRSNPVDTANNATDAPNPTDVDAPANDNNPDAPADVDTKPANPPQSNPRPRLTRAERRRLKRKNRKRPPKNRSP